MLLASRPLALVRWSQSSTLPSLEPVVDHVAWKERFPVNCQLLTKEYNVPYKQRARTRSKYKGVVWMLPQRLDAGAVALEACVRGGVAAVPEPDGLVARCRQDARVILQHM